jgi:hypothetical protein
MFIHHSRYCTHQCISEDVNERADALVKEGAGKTKEDASVIYDEV